MYIHRGFTLTLYFLVSCSNRVSGWALSCSAEANAMFTALKLIILSSTYLRHILTREAYCSSCVSAVPRINPIYVYVYYIHIHMCVCIYIEREIDR